MSVGKRGIAVDLTLEQGNQSRSKDEAGQPVMALLVERKKKKKKSKKKKDKKKVGLLVRVIGKIFLGSAAALGQMGEAVSDAADKYTRKHEKSRARRKDGWKKDLGRNVAGATSELLRGSAKAPGKFAKALWKKDKKKRKAAAVGDAYVARVEPVETLAPAPPSVPPEPFRPEGP